MDEPRGSGTARVTGRIQPGQQASATGVRTVAFSASVEYEGYQREGMRHAWTREPDDDDRYHALTLRREEEEDESAWEVTADQPFATLDEARDWAEQLFRETES